MTISYVGAVSTLTNTATATAAGAIPTGVQAGDLLIFASCERQGYTVATPPAGWTALRYTADVVVSQAIYWKIADGADAAPSLTYSGSVEWVTIVAAYRGVETSAPFLVEAAAAEMGGSGTISHAAPPLTNTDPAAWGLFGAVFRALPTPTSWAVDPPLVERLDVDNLESGSWNITAVLADTAGPATVGDHTFTGTSQRNGTSAGTSTAVMWAAFLRPSGTGPAPAEGAASGAWRFTGSAAGSTTRRGSAAGTWDFSGAAVGNSPRRGSAVGTWAWAASASGSAPAVDAAAGTATGAWAFTGTAAGVSVRQGTTAGAWGFVGAASGSAVDAMVPPHLPVTATIAPHLGAALLAVDRTGTATLAPHLGAATLHTT